MVIRCTWSRGWTASHYNVQTLIKLNFGTLLIDVSFLLNHKLARQGLIDSYLLIELVGKLLDLLVELTLVHRRMQT